MVSLNFSALFHLINSENGILILKDINYKIKRNQYELDVIKQTNFNLEDRILNFSKEKDNDLMDQVIREYLGYQSNSEVTIVYKNNQS
jgi:cell division protein FtsB